MKPETKPTFAPALTRKRRTSASSESSSDGEGAVGKRTRDMDKLCLGLGSSRTPKDPWGATFKSKEHFKDMHFC